MEKSLHHRRMGVIMKKKMMKLVVCAVMGALLVGLGACGKGEEDKSSQGTEQDSSQGQDSSQENSSAESEDISSVPSGEDGADDTSGEGLGGEESGEGWSEEMAGLKSAVVEALGENYWPNMALDSEMLEMTFGISPEWYDDYMAEMPMISVNVDALLIIKAKEGQADNVEEALNTYRDNRVNNLSEYPMNVGKVQASRIEKIGNYVLFVQLGADTTEIADEGDEAVIAHCLEVNDLVIEVISKKLEH